MTDSLADWLRLREPADLVARSTALTRDVIAAVAHHDHLNVVDLGTGTGANLRYLVDRLPARQDWLLVDRNPAVLAEIAAETALWGVERGRDVMTGQDEMVIRGPAVECHVRSRQLNLGGLTDRSIFSGRHLVAASALLDLVSDTWLHTLAECCRESGAAVLFALNYDGRSRCSPEEPEDDTVRELMNRHQRSRDHGFGPAAGPDATDCAAGHFASAGYQVRRAATDWVLAPAARELQRQLIEGWAEAAVEIAPDRAAAIASWLARRLAHVDAGRSHVTVGHEDLAAWLPS